MHVWAKTHVGLLRGRNEDYYATSAIAGQPTIGAGGASLQDKGWALLADGMGGHAAGEVASELAVECLRTLIDNLSSEAAVLEALNATNAALFEAMQRQPLLAGMGSTIAGLRIAGSEALLFNVGDTRIYTLFEGRLRQLSTDHALGPHSLTQCLGGWSRARMEPAVVTVPAHLGERFLLCSDGLHGMVPDESIAVLLGNPDPAAELVEAALAAGGHDNVTVVVVEVA